MSVLKFGILGTANIAQTKLIPAINNTPDCISYGVASRSLEKAQKFASENGIEKAYGSYNEMLADPQIDAVYIPLPSGMHFEWIIKCIDARKPVLCEKPMVLAADQLRQIIQKSKTSNVLVSEAAMFRYHPTARRVVELVRSGEIGLVRHITSHFFGEIAEGDFRYDANLGGGCLYDLGFYNVGISQLVANSSVTGMSATGTRNETGADIRANATLQFENGVDAIFACAFQGEFACSYKVYGSKGSIEMPFGGMVAWPGTSFKLVVKTAETQREELIEPTDHYQILVADFARSLQTKKPMEWGLDHTLASTVVVEKLHSLF